MSRFHPLAAPVLILAFVGVTIISCNKDGNEPPTPPHTATPYTLAVPEGFPEMAIPGDNPLTVEGIALGRRLYYDPIYSLSGKSCSSCHDQGQGFSLPVPGPSGQGILAHVNLGWHDYFGWAGGEHVLDDVPFADLADGNVFTDANGDTLLERLKASSIYPKMFQDAFGVNITSVTRDKREWYITRALAQFLRIMVSSDSKFDRFLRHEAGADFNISEMNGMTLFFNEQGDCFHCHGYPLLTNGDFHNNGLDSIFTSANGGRYGVTGNPSDIGKFRVPTLRNIELTPPYMHDGRFNTLEEVVEFYDSGVCRQSGNTDPLLQRPSRNLSPAEKADIVAFLKTLTDTTFTGNPAFSSPL